MHSEQRIQFKVADSVFLISVKVRNERVADVLVYGHWSHDFEQWVYLAKDSVFIEHMLLTFHRDDILEAYKRQESEHCEDRSIIG